MAIDVGGGCYDRSVIGASTHFADGHLDALPVPAIRRYEPELYAFLEAKHPAALKLLAEKRELTDDVKAKLDAALVDFDRHFKA